jgi:sugar lactone lactonase YvrE
MKICIGSTDTFNGGTIVVGNDVNAADGTCASSLPYIIFTSSNWAIKTVKVKGSRGTVGVTSDTNYSIQFSIISSDTTLSAIQIADVSMKNIDIDGSASFFVRTQLTGLTSGTLSIKLNNTQSLSLSLIGNDTFQTPLINGSIYSISIQSQPTGSTCAFISVPYGTISSTHVTIQIECVGGYIFNGTLFSTSTPPTLSQGFLGIQTIAGSFPTTITSGNIDGISTSARFNNPIAITMDSVNIYVADIFNSSVRKVRISDGFTSTLASITGPHGVATDGSNVYVTSYNTHKVFKVSILSGTVTTLAGTGVSGDVIGPAATAQFNTPTYLTTDGTCVYVSDRVNGKIKQIDIATGNVTTVSSGFVFPDGIATDGTNIYVADTNAHKVYRVLISTGVKTLIAGTGVAGGADNATGTSATLNAPYGITVDGSFIYVLEGTGKRFRRISATSPYAVVTIVAQSNGYADGVFGTAQFCAGGANCDSSITTDGVTLYMADRYTHSIRKLYY